MGHEENDARNDHTQHRANLTGMDNIRLQKARNPIHIVVVQADVVITEQIDLGTGYTASFEVVLNLFEIVQSVTDVLEPLHKRSLFIIVYSSLPAPPLGSSAEAVSRGWPLCAALQTHGYTPTGIALCPGKLPMSLSIDAPPKE